MVTSLISETASTDPKAGRRWLRAAYAAALAPVAVSAVAVVAMMVGLLGLSELRYPSQAPELALQLLAVAAGAAAFGCAGIAGVRAWRAGESRQAVIAGVSAVLLPFIVGGAVLGATQVAPDALREARSMAQLAEADARAAALLADWAGTSEADVMAAFVDGLYGGERESGILATHASAFATAEWVVEGEPGSYALTYYTLDIDTGERLEDDDPLTYAIAPDEHAEILRKALDGAPRYAEPAVDQILAFAEAGYEAFRFLDEFPDVVVVVDGHDVAVEVPNRPDLTRTFSYPQVSERTLVSTLERHTFFDVVRR